MKIAGNVRHAVDETVTQQNNNSQRKKHRKVKRIDRPQSPDELDTHHPS